MEFFGILVVVAAFFFDSSFRNIIFGIIGFCTLIYVFSKLPWWVTGLFIILLCLAIVAARKEARNQEKRKERMQERERRNLEEMHWRS